MSTGRSARIRRSSTLSAPADVVWRAVHAPAALVHVAAPLLRMPELEQRTDPWRRGESVTTRLLLFGVLPVHQHTVTVVDLDEEGRTVRTAEHGGLIARWEHRICVQPLEGRTCRYTDEVEIDAGRLTAVVRIAAGMFYRWRHARWRRLAPVLAATADG